MHILYMTIEHVYTHFSNHVQLSLLPTNKNDCLHVFPSSRYYELEHDYPTFWGRRTGDTTNFNIHMMVSFFFFKRKKGR